MAKLTEEQRKFISSKYLDENKTGQKIIKEFGEKFGFIPSASVINKYQYYNETIEEKEVKPKEEKPKKEEKELTIVNDDNDKNKDIFDFSGGEIPDEIFDKLSETTGRSKYSLFEVMKKARHKGYKTVNLKTGELKK